MKKAILSAIILLFVCVISTAAQSVSTRKFSGVAVSQRNELVPNVTLIIRYASGEQTIMTDAEGHFSTIVPNEPLSLIIYGKGIKRQEKTLSISESTEDLTFNVEIIIPQIHASLVIQADTLEPAIDQRNSAVFNNTLFGRDDQLLQNLAAGINAGQHEGGGKSLEIRRFGFNLDHGGVNGGLKILVDNFGQNQTTQGHGQGYLGQLKSLTPELVQSVEILNGPFNAQYGDFSGLGVVHIRLRESLPDKFTFRVQGGSFNTFRSFAAFSPELKNAKAFIAYEASRTDGPFISPLKYKRDNVTGNYALNLRERQTLGFKFNFGRNNFFSSGQIPLDEVAAGRLDRFGFIDPDNGGRVKTGFFGAYYRKDFEDGSAFKADAFLARSLFDLFSNFSFFLTDETHGDEIQQHDSRLQEGANVQYLKPYKLFGQQSLITVGGNFHANQILVGLYPSKDRVPNRKFQPENINNTNILLTDANAKVTNAAWYVQNAVDLFDGRVHIEGGLRYDYFRFNVKDKIEPNNSGVRGASRFQPKFTFAYTPTHKVPFSFYFNYGRGIASQDARGIVQDSAGPAISTTDFYQTGAAFNSNRFSVSTSLFLIDRSNEQVYIPDDGSIEFAGASRAYGFETKTSVRLNRYLSFNGGLTQVMNAFYRGTNPRAYVDSAPHTVGNGQFTFSGWRGLSMSLGYRHISNYRLDGEDSSIRASGLDVVDFSLNKEIKRWVTFNFAIDNLLNKRFFETQNYFESRLRPGDPVNSRIHATPGYPFGVNIGLTFRLGKKE